MNAAAKLAIVPDDAAALLDLLALGEPITFQTFGEGDAKAIPQALKQPWPRKPTRWMRFLRTWRGARA